MGRGWLLSAIFFTFIFSSFGFSDSHTVDLSYLFPQSEAPAQEGSTCHVFSAASLIEATCRRELGRPVSVSRAFLVLNHLSRAIGEHKMNLEGADFLALMGDNSPFDRGFSVDSLQFVRSKRRLLSEQEMPMNTPKLDFWRGSLKQEIKALADAALSIRGEIDRLRLSVGEPVAEGSVPILVHILELVKLRARQRGMQKQHEEAYLEKLRAGLAQWDSFPDSGTGTADQDLQDCLDLFDDSREKSLKPTSYYYTPGTAMALLEAEIPFACGGPMDTKYFYWDGWMNHSTVFVGYRENTEFPDRIEYLVRDHDGKPASWGWGVEQCEISTLEMR